MKQPGKSVIVALNVIDVIALLGCVIFMLSPEPERFHPFLYLYCILSLLYGIVCFGFSVIGSLLKYR